MAVHTCYICESPEGINMSNMVKPFNQREKQLVDGDKMSWIHSFYINVRIFSQLEMFTGVQHHFRGRLSDGCPVKAGTGSEGIMLCFRPIQMRSLYQR